MAETMIGGVVGTPLGRMGANLASFPLFVVPLFPCLPPPAVASLTVLFPTSSQLLQPHPDWTDLATIVFLRHSELPKQ